MKVGVYGAGSIGCYLGGLLASVGANIRFIGREHLKKVLSKHDLTLTHYMRSDITVPTSQFTFDLNVKGLADADIIFVTVKSKDTKEAGLNIAKVANKNALIISFQNGVNNVDVLVNTMPGYNVLAAVVPFNVTSTGPGRFHSGTEGNLIIQSNQSMALTELKSLFIKARQDCQTVDDISSVQWGKLLVNLNNAVNTLNGRSLKAGLLQKDYRLALALIIDEALEIVAIAKIATAPFGKASPEKMIKILRLPNFAYRFIMNRIIKIDDDARSSMLDDLETGRDSEVDYLQGEIVRLSEKIGHPAPINEFILNQVNHAFKKGQSPKMHGTDILRAVLKAKNQAA